MPKRFKKLSLALSLSLCLALFAGCVPENGTGETLLPDFEENESYEAEYYMVDKVFGLNCDRDQSFSPYQTSSYNNMIVGQLIYDSLFELDHNFSPVPEIVTEYETLDGIEWTFTVDTSIKFWDGTNLTPADCAYSVVRAMGSPQFRDRFDCIYWAYQISDSQFAVKLDYANMQLPSLLDIPVIKSDSSSDFVPMGTGPYIPNEELTEMHKFEEYKYADSLSVDVMYLKEFNTTNEIITAYEDSEIDLVTNDPTGFYNLGYGSANEIRYCNTSNMHYIGFNSVSRIFSNPAVRQLITYIIDRESVVSTVMNGAATAATLPMHPNAELYNEDFAKTLNYSLSSAKAAMEKAQIMDYDDDGFLEMMMSGIPVETDFVFLVCNESPSKLDAARLIAKDMQELGLKVTLKEVSWSEYLLSLEEGTFDMYYAEVKLPADFNSGLLYLPEAPMNYGKFTETVYQDVVNNYMNAIPAQATMYADYMFKTVSDLSPIIPVCFEKMQVITHRGVVKGLSPTQNNIFREMQNWEISFD